MNDFRKLMEKVKPLFEDEEIRSEVPTALGENDDEDRHNALSDLMGIMEELHQLSEQADDIMQNYFPDEYRTAKAYGALDFGTSSNPHDTTFDQIIQDLEAEFNDPGEY